MMTTEFPPGFVDWTLAGFLRDTTGKDHSDLLNATKMWIKENVGPEMVEALRDGAIARLRAGATNAQLLALLGYFTMFDGRWAKDVHLFREFAGAGNSAVAELASYFANLSLMSPPAGDSEIADEAMVAFEGVMAVAGELELSPDLVRADMTSRLAGKGLAFTRRS